VNADCKRENDNHYRGHISFVVPAVLSFNAANIVLYQVMIARGEA